MNIFDIGILSIFAISMIIGFGRGFYKSFASLFGWVVSTIISVLLAKAVANSLVQVPFISKYFFNNPDGFCFADWFYGMLPESLRIDMNTVRGWLIVDGELVSNGADLLALEIKDKHSFCGTFFGLFRESYLAPIASPEMLSYDVDNLARAISILLANSLLILFSGLLLLIVFKIISIIIIRVLEKGFNLKKGSPNLPNRLLGMVFGGVNGFVVCVALFIVFGFVINLSFLTMAREHLFEDESIFAASFATTVFETTDTLLTIKDLPRVMENAGYKLLILDDPENFEGQEINDPPNEDFLPLLPHCT